jgi:arylformamidase
MPLYDATLPIRMGMVTFPGDPRFEMQAICRQSKGDPFNLALLSMGTHLGTHVDPPAHYIEDGATVDQIPLQNLVGPGVVLDMTGRDRVDRKALENSALDHHVRVLLKTDNFCRLLDDTFHEDYVHLTEDGAAYLVEREVLMVGIDYLSIEQYDHVGAPVHMTLLKAGVVILEGANLSEVPAGPCEIYCLPLKIVGADGAPARLLVRNGAS